MGLTQTSTPALDGFPLRIGDGAPRARAIRLTDYATPLWVRVDMNPLKVVQVDTMPTDLAMFGGYIELLSGDPALASIGNSYYVSTTGSALNNGSISSPWSLAHALAGAGGVIQPGDTIYIRGGTYVGSFEPSNIDGTSSKRITFRQYGGDAPLGERVTIDGHVEIKRKYIDFRGMEIFQSDPNSFGDEGLQLGSDSIVSIGSRVINCVIHDAGQTGITHWLNCFKGVIYGVISYNNGTNHNLDHGFYCHDQEYMIDTCMAFNNLARGFQCYDSLRDQKNVILRKLISFGNGEISVVVDRDMNYISRVLSPRIMDNFAMEDCVGFHKINGTKGQQLRFGTFGNITGQKEAFLRRLYLWHGNVNMEINEFQKLSVEDVTAVDSGATQPIVLLREIPSSYVSWKRNKWFRDPALNKWTLRAKRFSWESWKVAAGLGNDDIALADSPKTVYFLFSNDYSIAEGKGRGHLAIFNHEGLASVPVDISTIIPVGANFELRNVQDLWGTPVLSGVFTGGLISVPMTVGVTPPTPIGPTRVFATPPITAPDFDAFLVLQV